VLWRFCTSYQSGHKLVNGKVLIREALCRGNVDAEVRVMYFRVVANHARKEVSLRLLTGTVGLIAAFFTVAAPLSVLWNEANEAEGLRNASPAYVSTAWSALGVLALAGIAALLPGLLAYKLLRFSLKGKAEYFRWTNVPLTVLIGAVSGWMLFVTIRQAYWEYYLYPKLKALDGYIYPQMRYTIFSAVVTVWCVDGLAACVLLIQNAANRRSIQGWSYRTMLIFVVGFGLLVIGFAYGMCLRSMGL
jgi:hypothetical protein